MVRDLENHTCMSQFQAEIASKMLYAKGYRKQSEGEWITLFEDDSPWDSIWICNRCGAYTTTEEPAYKNFCPNCGAKMKGENNE